MIMTWRKKRTVVMEVVEAGDVDSSHNMKNEGLQQTDQVGQGNVGGTEDNSHGDAGVTHKDDEMGHCDV